MEKLCLRCGGANLEDGTLRLGEAFFDPVTFRPARVSEFTFDKTRVDVDTAVCADCGQLDLRCDPGTLRRLLERHGRKRD